MIHRAKDNSAKMILDEPELFVEFLQSFIKLDILRDVTLETVFRKPSVKPGLNSLLN